MKNIYIILIRTAALLAAVFTLNSCLEKFPKDTILETEAMTSLSGAEQIVTGIYTAYMSGGLYSGYLTLVPDIQSDLVMAVEGNSNTYGEIYQWTFRPTNAEIETIYAGLYTVIGRCNFYLDQVEELRAQMSSDEDIRTLDQYTGEVHCARALAYSELIKCFCEAYDPKKAEEEQLGVVLRSSYFKEEPVTRSTLKKSYQFVISDLEKAEELLDEDGNAYNAPYFTKGAAQAVRARVALYMQDWSTAVKYSGMLIENDAYDLSMASYNVGSQGPAYNPSAGVQNEIDYLWTNDSGYEVIWRIGFTQTSYGGPLGNVFLHFTTDYYYYYPDFVPAQWALNLYKSGDARYNAYFCNLTTGYPHQLSWPLLVKYYGNEGLMSLLIYHVNMPKPLRLAEQYLIRAEANCNLGQFGAASNDLTKLRNTRYKNSGGTISVGSDTWQKIIEEERVRELYMEGFRLNDLKRWGKGFKREPQASVQSEGSRLEVKADDPRFVWPIPKHEIEAPGSSVQPNPSNNL